MIDQLATDTRTDRLRGDPLRSDERQPGALVSRRQRGPEERPPDRTDRDHHPRGQQVSDGDRGHRVGSREEKDPRRIEELRRDERDLVSDTIREHAPHPLEEEHAKAEHRQRDADLTRTRPQLSKLERNRDLQHSSRKRRDEQHRDKRAAPAADQRGCDVRMVA